MHSVKTIDSHFLSRFKIAYTAMSRLHINTSACMDMSDNVQKSKQYDSCNEGT